jgi:hypothetical protein
MAPITFESMTEPFKSPQIIQVIYCDSICRVFVERALCPTKDFDLVSGGVYALRRRLDILGYCFYVCKNKEVVSMISTEELQELKAKFQRDQLFAIKQSAGEVMKRARVAIDRELSMYAALLRSISDYSGNVCSDRAN